MSFDMEMVFSPTKQEHHYYFIFEIESDLKVINELIANIGKPFIFNSGTLNNHFFDVYYEDGYTLERAVDDILSQISDENNIWKQAEILCTEDVVWGDECNKEYLYKVYSKYILKDEYINFILTILKNWKKQLEKMKEEAQAQIDREKAEKEARKQKYTVLKTYRKDMPKGGEGGQDGYFDALIKNNQTGEQIRTVARNVFDFGFYTYPKRLEGTNDIFENEKYTEEENNVCQWLNEFSPFTKGIRM